MSSLPRNGPATPKRHPSRAKETRNPLMRIINHLSMREREVRDSMWLLGCMLLVCAPLFPTLPLWIVVGFIALLAWRTRIAWLGKRLPPRALLIALLLLTGAGVFLQYHTVVGKDAGVAYIVLLLGLKLMELKARRDIFVVVYLCLFIMLTTLFDNQTMFNAAWLIVDVVVLTAALIRVSFAGSDPPMRVKLKLALQMTGFAIPLMVVLFVLFPRVSGPLWGLPSDAFTGLTGLSETMSPGSFSGMAQSDEVAFTVKFKNRVPSAAKRYWRGPVLSFFDGRTWRPGGYSAEPPAALNVEANATSEVEYSETLEPSNRPWLLLLDAPADRPFVAGQNVTLRADLQAQLESPIRERMRFEARGYTEFHYGKNETQGRLTLFRQTPRNTNPRLLAYATELRSKFPDPKMLVATLLTQIHQENFYYTLSPPLYDGRNNSLDQFFFDGRRGFCEHYASATAVLLRDAGIPARVVTGYLGGEINTVNGFLLLRQRDAHAWVEYWTAEDGWTRVDPTAAIAPERIDIELLPQSDPVQTSSGDYTTSNLSLARYLRLHMDAVKIAWDQFVVGYSGDDQAGLLSRFGIPQLDWQSLTIALAVGFSLVLAVIAGQLLVTREKPEPVVRLYQKLCRELARAGITRAASEGPRDLAARAEAKLSGAGRDAVAAAFAQYLRVRYSNAARLEPGALAELKRLVRRVSRTPLKS